MHYAFFLSIVVIWSASFLLMKKAALYFPPTTIGAWRLIGGAAIVTIVWWWKGSRWSVRPIHIPPLAFIVLAGFVGPFSLQPWLVARHGSALIGMTVSFVPLFTLLVSIPVLQVRPTRLQTAGVLGALTCLLALMVDGLRREVPLRDLGLALTVPLGYAVSNIVIRRWLKGVPSLDLTCLCLVAASLVMAPSVMALSPEVEPHAVPREDVVVALGSIAILGILGTGVAQVMFNYLIQHRGPLFAGMVTNLVPVGAVLWGWLDAEHVTALQIAALFGVVAMVAIVQIHTPRVSE